MSDRRSRVLMLILALFLGLGPSSAGWLHDDGSTPARLGESAGIQIAAASHDADCAICAWAAVTLTTDDSSATDEVRLAPTATVEHPIDVAPASPDRTRPPGRGPPRG